MAVLKAEALGISFGGLKAVDDFHVEIEKKELYGLIGPNGAGKTTIFNLLTGVYRPESGRILLDGENIAGKSCVEINQRGIARTSGSSISSACSIMSRRAFTIISPIPS